MSPRSPIVVLVGGLLIVALAAGCSGSSSGAHAQTPTDGSGRPVDGGQMVVAVGGETNGWNPHRDEWAQGSSLVGSSVLEPLATTGHDLSAKPWLASSWTSDATFASWTIVLRSGVVFQDGEPFDAAAVKQNLDDASSAPLSGEALKGMFKDVVVVDDHTVRVDLTQPWAAFPSSFLDGQSAVMMAPAMLKSSDQGQAHPIGTGPFTFVSWQPGSDFVTRRNPTYWQRGLPHLDKLTFKVITDSTTQVSALKAGDVDLVFSASAASADDLAGHYAELRDWSTEPGMAMTNTLPQIAGKANPMANRHARLALAYATDQNALAAGIAPGLQIPTSPFPPSSPWGMPQSQNGYPNFDLGRARNEVAQYKSESGESSLDLTLATVPDPAAQHLAAVLQAQWKEAGIDVQVEAIDQTTFITNVVAGDYQVALFNIYSSPDPDQNHYFWSAETASGVGKVSINFTQYTTPRMQADLKAGRESSSFHVRKRAYDDLVRQINAAAVNIWTISTPYSLIAVSRVHGLGGAKTVPFGNFQPKTWLANVWVG